MAASTWRTVCVSDCEVFLICCLPSISLTALWSPGAEGGSLGRVGSDEGGVRHTSQTKLLYHCCLWLRLPHTHMHNAFTPRAILLKKGSGAERILWSPAAESQGAEARALLLFTTGHFSARPWEPADWNSEFIAVLIILCSRRWAGAARFMSALHSHTLAQTPNTPKSKGQRHFN